MNDILFREGSFLRQILDLWSAACITSRPYHPGHTHTTYGNGADRILQDAQQHTGPEAAIRQLAQVRQGLFGRPRATFDLAELIACARTRSSKHNK